MAGADLAHSNLPVMQDDNLAFGSRLSDLTSRFSSIVSSCVSPNITIPGIPAFVVDYPKTMVLRVFKSLGIPELAVDVLEIRSL